MEVMEVKKYRLFRFFISVAFILIGAIIVVLIARGYKVNLPTKNLLSTGLLVSTSFPDGASVFIDGKLKTATNSTLNLLPGEYEVEIKKDGYTPWKKTLQIKKELVVKTDAYLFVNFPDFRALTFTGAQNPVLSPDGTKVVYAVADHNDLKNQGLWLLELVDRPLGLSRGPKQIVANNKNYDFSRAKIRWSPDSKQILVTFESQIGKGKTAKTIKENFLLDTDKLNSVSALTNITPTLSLLEEGWEKQKELQLEAQLSKLHPELLKIFRNNTAEIQFSPDETKIMYTATASALIPRGLISLPPVVSTQPEERTIKPARVYVYDLKEDKNFFISETPHSKNSLLSLLWFPTSKHIFIVQKDKISIIEYDGTNKVDVYSGPLENSFAFPFPSGDRFLILASLSKDKPPNLYAIRLR